VTLREVFERFTDRARRVLVLAQEEARLLGHGFIGTEHILLGLIHESEGLAAHALASLGISLDAVRDDVQRTTQRPSPGGGGSPPFTPRAKKLLEGALREALQLGHKYIGTEHLLLGLVREGEGAAVEVLQRLGADVPHVRAEIVRLMQNHQARETDTSASPYCPRCGDPLAKTLRHRTVQSTGETPTEKLAITVVYCGTCGTAVGRRE
jgi:ATP-dependent Clp protease ATP-binding subunit ClpC